MKVEVRREKKAKRTYPFLGIAELSGIIILFVNSVEGIMLTGEDTGEYIGDLDITEYADYVGTIILSND